MTVPEPKVLSLADWKALDKTGAAPHGIALRKAWACNEVISKAEMPALGEREVQLIISTSKPDRDNDVINADGWKLTSYRKNPVVLFAHDYRSLPIGRARKVQAGDGLLKAIDHFVEQEVYPLAEIIFQMLKRGYLNAASVGFAPLKWLRNEDRGGYDFEEQELLEHSIVPVPANAGALVELRQLTGLDLKPLAEWAEKFLDEIGGTDKDLPVDPRRVIAMLKQVEGRVVLGWTKDDDAELPEVDGFEFLAVNPKGSGAPPLPAPSPAPAGAPPAPVPTPNASLGGAHDRLAWIVEGTAGGPGRAFFKQGFTVQSLIFPRKHWNSADAVKRWAREHDFRGDTIDETAEAFRIRQREPEEFQHLKTVALTPNDTVASDEKCQVRAVGGALKASGEPKLALPGWDHADVDAGLVVTSWLETLERGVLPYRRTALAAEGESWDGAAELGLADVPGLKAMSCWFKGDGATKEDYRLAHHKAEGEHACVWKGVAAAAARLPLTDLPAADQAGVRRHLARHYEDFGKEAPWKLNPVGWEKYETLVVTWKASAERDLTPPEMCRLLRQGGFEVEARAVESQAQSEAVTELFANMGMQPVAHGSSETLSDDEFRKMVRDALEPIVDAGLRKHMGRLD